MPAGGDEGRSRPLASAQAKKCCFGLAGSKDAA
jgi:hypothetical protein